VNAPLGVLALAMAPPLSEQAGGGTSSTLRSGMLLIERDEDDTLLDPACVPCLAFWCLLI
jgi:hypothetical protein